MTRTLEQRETLRERKVRARVEVEIEPRRSITKSQRAAAFLRAGGRCEKCRVKPDLYEVDHRIPRARGGIHAPENWQILCVPCHKIKTKQDVSDIAKENRIIDRELNGPKTSRLRSRGFDKTKTRKFNGTVAKRGGQNLSPRR